MTIRRGVLSLLNTQAGEFAWYEAFPRRITELLAAEGIEHRIGYKSYLPESSMPAEGRLAIDDEVEATSGSCVRRQLGPVAARFDHFILHTHSYTLPEVAFWQVTAGRRWRRWWATAHTTYVPRRGLAHLARLGLQRVRIGYPDRLYGCSVTATAALTRMYNSGTVGTLLNGRLGQDDLERFPQRGPPRRALFVGRLTPEKGTSALLEASRMVARRFPDFHLTIVGTGPDEARMVAWIREHALGERITMKGHQHDVTPSYAEADFVVMPTDPLMIQEGLGLVALEAKAFALPVIYSSSGGLPETQIEGWTGFLVEPPDADHIATAMIALMGDTARYDAMRACIRDERRRWTLDRMANDYVREYLAEFSRRPSRT